MIKKIPENCIAREGKKNGKPIYHAELVADTCAELIGVTEDDDFAYDFGSAAICGKNGEVCLLMSDGKWYKMSDGTEVTA